MICLAVLLAAAATAYAQGPAASIQILAPSFRVIAGESMRIRSIVRDAAGRERPLDIPIYSTDNPNIATIEPFSGEFTSRGLGVSRITARLGSISSSIFVQVLPKRVAISPPSATLTVGEQRQFTATAYNKDDEPIPNVTFRWFTTSGNGFSTNTASVSSTGMLRTVAVGNILVRASFDYNSNVIPGFERQAQAIATVSIQPPRTYQLKKLLGTGALRGPFRLRARILPLLGNERGQVVFNASLDGVSNGPLLLDGSHQTLLAYGGMPGPLPQTSVIEFPQLAINNRGEILALTSILFSGSAIYRLRPGETPEPLYVDPMPLPGTEFLTSPFLNRNCLNDSGGWVFRANYRIANAGPTYTAIFRVPQRGFPDEVVSTRTPLPNFPATFSLDADFGIAGDGTVYFTASSGSERALFVRQFDSIRRLLGIGDALLGSTVSRFFGNGFFLNDRGELAVAVGLANGQIHLLRYSNLHTGAAPRTLALRSFGNLYTISPTQGVLFLGDVGRGYGVHLWREEAVAVFLQGSTLLRGKTVPAIDWATVSSAGEVTIMARTQDSPMEIFYLRPGEPPIPILQAGDLIDVRAPVSISNIMAGDRVGPVHVYLGGRNSSIFEVTEHGLQPVMLMGERFTTTGLFPGTGTGDRKTSSGDILISQTAGLGIMRVKANGVTEVLQRPGHLLEDGATANAAFNVQGNARGDLLWAATTNRGDQRLFIRRGEQITTITTNGALASNRTVVDGNYVIAWSDQMLDETGRVMLNLRFADNSLALYLWDNGVFTRVAQINETRHDGSLVTNIFQIRAGGDAFYAIFSLQGIGNTLVCYRGGRWETVVAVTDILVTGHTANSIGSFDVNRHGDVVLQCNTNTQVIAIKRRGKMHYIHMLTELTPEDELLTRTSDFDIRDDGTVYFLGMTVNEEYALYQAKPL
ncbi:MAG: Ig-like domain-containing protein [Bryobacteraceae bacterium]|nr:Ig-like domain-containing protein [Bryobacteraceae bacterium]MDW8379853.1 hypothetical protein [Bryobacterales bacterium]